VFRQRRAERSAIARRRGFPEHRISGQQPGAFDQALRIELEQTLEGTRSGHDLGAYCIADGPGGVHMNQDEAGRSHGDQQQHDRRQQACLQLMERQIGKAHGQPKWGAHGRPAAVAGQLTDTLCLRPANGPARCSRSAPSLRPATAALFISGTRICIFLA
jgi:hypothetical protein